MDRLTEDSLFEHHLNEDSGIGNDYDYQVGLALELN